MPTALFAKGTSSTIQSAIPELKELACTHQSGMRCFQYVPPKDTFPVFEPLALEKVIDGDTLVASGRTVRLWGINAQEEGAPYYEREKLLLTVLTKEGKLTCKLIDTDPYKTQIMQCLIDGLDLGAMMVRMGMAKELKNYSGGYYTSFQDMAQKERRGIWKDIP